MFLVYLSTNGKVFPQKWPDIKFNSEAGKQRTEGLVQKHKLPVDHQNMTLNELMSLYPLEEKKDE